MKLSFKNKMLMGILAMCEEGVKKSGIPKHIRLTTGEGVELLKEIHYLINDGENVSAIKMETHKLENLEDQFHPARLIPMILNSLTPLTDQTVLLVAGFWAGGEITVSYQYDTYTVPLFVDKAKKIVPGGWNP